MPCLKEISYSRATAGKYFYKSALVLELMTDGVSVSHKEVGTVLLHTSKSGVKVQSSDGITGNSYSRASQRHQKLADMDIFICFCFFSCFFFF